MQRDDRNSFGFGLKQLGPGHFEISHITPHGPAYKNGEMTKGDNVIAINDMKITENIALDTITTMVKESGCTMRLTLNSGNVRKGMMLIFGMNIMTVIKTTFLIYIY